MKTTMLMLAIVFIASATALAKADEHAVGCVFECQAGDEPAVVLMDEVMKGRHNGLYLGAERIVNENGTISWLFDCPFDENCTCYKWEKHVDGSADIYRGDGGLLEHYDSPVSHVSHYESSYIDEQGQEWMHYEETFDPAP